ncbi:hypothetical protein M407DRAFT_18075 [Tulasnella calospora MUT 4182]|uniref:Uncharacterized protein n=1 Tax=Tulasnella calospora MUT 4182 TaxID=1051891 RepID=A0A0C3QU81_9AGAM|nr:hypothetical protein M407DRAFT_18075 [Tulasnella calospora MUT 4182]
MTSEDIEFHGLGGSDPPAEAEDFIAAIKKCAFRESRQRDNDWLCDFAATCIRVRWFAKLEMEDPQVVESWKLLQNAILAHYSRILYSRIAFRGSGGEGEHRTRVVNEDGECLGYLGRATSLLPDYWEGCLDAACDEANAFRVIAKPGTGDTKLSRIFVLGPDEWLVIKWEKSFRSRAAVALFEETKEGSLTSRLHPHRWVGQTRTTVWEIGSGRKIIPNGPCDTFGFIAYEPTRLAGGITIIYVKL